AWDGWWDGSKMRIANVYRPWDGVTAVYPQAPPLPFCLCLILVLVLALVFPPSQVLPNQSTQIRTKNFEAAAGLAENFSHPFTSSFHQSSQESPREVQSNTD